MDVAIGAVQLRREAPHRFLVRKRMHVHPTMTGAQRGLQRFRDPRRLRAAHSQAILHDVQHPAATGVNARVALRLEQLDDLVFREVVRNRDRKRDHQPRIAGRGACDRHRRHGCVCGVSRVTLRPQPRQYRVAARAYKSFR